MDKDQTTPRFKCTAPETYEQQEKDAQMIFRQLTSSPGIATYKQAERICTIYVADPEISRSGIGKALMMLKRHFAEPGDEA